MTAPLSPHRAAKHAVCPACSAELAPERSIVATWPGRHHLACRIVCRECLTIVRIRESFRLHTAEVEIPGSVVVRRLQAIREAREAGRLSEELARLRESRAHRLLLRVPEVFAEARHLFRERARLAFPVSFASGVERMRVERFSGVVSADVSPARVNLEERWTRTPFRCGQGWGMPAGWVLPIAGIEGTCVALKPHAAVGAEEPRSLPSGMAGFLAPLDVLAPEDGVW